jgi:hypothetical protein
VSARRAGNPPDPAENAAQWHRDDVHHAAGAAELRLRLKREHQDRDQQAGSQQDETAHDLTSDAYTNPS